MNKKPILTGLSEIAEKCGRAAAELVCTLLMLYAICFCVDWVDQVRLW